MLSRAELEFKSRACLAQLKLRIVAFSIAVAVPVWVGFWILQKLKFNLGFGAHFIGALLLVVYGIGVVRIYRRTIRDHQLNCGKCGASLGVELGNVTPAGACARCGEQITGPAAVRAVSK
jgi:hypothetical protein